MSRETVHKVVTFHQKSVHKQLQLAYTENQAEPILQFSKGSQLMNQSQPPSVYGDTGFLKARVYTALGAIPLEGVNVKISSVSEMYPPVAYDLITDRNGETDTVSLPAPSRELSTVPGNYRPYALYQIEAYLKDYGAYSVLNVPVFGGVLSVQPIGLVPNSARDPSPIPQPPADNAPSDLELRGE